MLKNIGIFLGWFFIYLMLGWTGGAQTPNGVINLSTRGIPTVRHVHAGTSLSFTYPNSTFPIGGYTVVLLGEKGNRLTTSGSVGKVGTIQIVVPGNLPMGEYQVWTFVPNGQKQIYKAGNAFISY